MGLGDLNASDMDKGCKHSSIAMFNIFLNYILSLLIEELFKLGIARSVEYLLRFIALKVWGSLLILLVLIAVGLWMKRRSLRSLTTSTSNLTFRTRLIIEHLLNS